MKAWSPAIICLGILGISILVSIYQGSNPSLLESIDSTDKATAHRTRTNTPTGTPTGTRDITKLLDKEPTMTLLSLIQYTDSEGGIVSFRLIQKIQNRCRDLGTLLGIDKPTLDNFERNMHHGRERVCVEILSEWITRGEGDYSITWAGLLQALKNIQLKTIADHLEEALTLYDKEA